MKKLFIVTSILLANISLTAQAESKEFSVQPIEGVEIVEIKAEPNTKAEESIIPIPENNSEENFEQPTISDYEYLQKHLVLTEEQDKIKQEIKELMDEVEKSQMEKLTDEEFKKMVELDGYLEGIRVSIIEAVHKRALIRTIHKHIPEDKKDAFFNDYYKTFGETMRYNYLMNIANKDVVPSKEYLDKYKNREHISSEDAEVVKDLIIKQIDYTEKHIKDYEDKYIKGAKVEFVEE